LSDKPVAIVMGDFRNHSCVFDETGFTSISSFVRHVRNFNVGGLG